MNQTEIYFPEYTNERGHLLAELLKKRIVMLDGAMGTMIQRQGLTEADFRGTRFADHSCDLKGDNDLLVLTRPELIEKLHCDFIAAGADIIETNTFNATRIAQADYQLGHLVREINLEGARLARRAADAAMAADPARQIFVAGSIGPTNRTASISPNVNDPAFRAVDFDELAGAYREQIDALMEGGVDLLLPETVFDTLNLKACLHAAEEWFEERGVRVPLMISLTVSDKSGRNLAGQMLEACWYSVEHARPLSIGLNCALGAAAMRPHIEALSTLVPCHVSVYANAGLPDAFGQYGDTPEDMARIYSGFARDGLANIYGGCCGTTPEHIRTMAEAVRPHPPRKSAPPDSAPRYSGLEPLRITPDMNMIMVGERTNITGSPKFARLVREGRLEEALAIARQQIENGANIIDINMDEGLIDAKGAMIRFLRLIAAEPDIARVPVMIDSSRWEVIEAGLKNLQGKGIVNSISLKEGEETFRAHARAIRRLGAAMIVMAFDEEGQAATTARRVEICTRAYRILVDQMGIPPRSIIFDLNVFPLATGMEEHRANATSFYEAARIVKQTLPGVLISGGISNVSFAFRGNNRVREAIHAVFLYHAVAAGLDMGIVNAGMLAVYDELPPDLLEAVEDVVLDRRSDATERLTTLAATIGGKVEDAAAKETTVQTWRTGTAAERLRHALVKGIGDFVAEDVAAALAELGSPLRVIEGPLMVGMEEVGRLFGCGRMFLPQVVKSARVMKQAVDCLTPALAAASGSEEPTSAGKILLATVKGDVHDIGKNIVAVVLACNNFEIRDLGVMVPCETILQEAQAWGADIVALSGLITPSLDEMAHVAREMQRAGMRQPLMIGGATTSQMHTAVRIAPLYDGITVHSSDASGAAATAQKLMSQDIHFRSNVREAQVVLRRRHAVERRAPRHLTLAKAHARRPACNWAEVDIPIPVFTGERVFDNLSVEDLTDFIDWRPFFQVWDLHGPYPAILTGDTPLNERAREVFSDAQRLLRRISEGRLFQPRGVLGIYPAASVGDDIEIYTDASRGTRRATFHFLRQQIDHGDKRIPNRCLADFIAPREAGRADHLALFAVTSGLEVVEIARCHKAAGDYYNCIMIQALGDRLAEAFAEYIHLQARRAWGCEEPQPPIQTNGIRIRYRGIRSSPGYPACPDHTEKAGLFELMDVTRHTGIALTEGMAMNPPGSVCGFVFANPEASNFAVGPIHRDQVADYAARKGMEVAAVEKWLAPNLGYER